MKYHLEEFHECHCENFNTVVNLFDSILGRNKQKKGKLLKFKNFFTVPNTYIYVFHFKGISTLSMVKFNLK